MKCRWIDDAARPVVCAVCGRQQNRPTNAVCRVSATPNAQDICPMRDIVVRLKPYGIDRLQLCREARCGLMHKVDGIMKCVGMRGSKCGWLTEWAACLNKDNPFPSGTHDCPHWKNSPMPIDEQGDSHGN